MDKSVEQNYMALFNKWKQLLSIVAENPNYSPSPEFLDTLTTDTIDFLLDFKFLQQPEILSAEHKTKLFEYFTTVARASQNDDVVGRVKLMVHTCTGGWTMDAIALGLLNGKIGKQMGTGNIDKNLKQYLINEDPKFLECRIKKITDLYQKSDLDKSYQIAVNFFESYKKILVTDKFFQDKATYKCLQKILDNLLICLSYLKMYEHLSSVITALPEIEKLRLLSNYQIEYCSQNSTQTFSKYAKHKSFVILEIIQTMLREECGKLRNEQNMHKLNMLVQYLVDFAQIDSFICSNLELVLMNTVSMKVNSNFYYLAANSIREKLENQHELLVLKLYITGLSLDLSYYEEMKFDKSLNRTHFTEAHSKFFQVFIVISFLINDPAVKRQCVRVANVFESTNTIIAKRLNEFLDNGIFPGEGVHLKSKINVLNDLKILLGNFDQEVQRQIKMDDRIVHHLPESFENLKYFSKGHRPKKRLSPIRYPGIEPGFKKHNSDDDDEEENSSKSKMTNGKNEERVSRKYNQIHYENKLFLAKMSNLFKSIKDPDIDHVEDRKPVNQYSSKQVRDFYLSVAPMCSGFVVKNGELYFRVDKITVEEILLYKQYSEHLSQEAFKKSKEYLKHDFSKCEKHIYKFDPIDLDSFYAEGDIDVWKLISNGFTHFDIQNILFCSILYKKFKFGENFKAINFNRDEELPQMKKVFNYMTFRGQPEYSRIVLLPTVVKNYFTMMCYNADTYKYELNNMNKYKYSKKKNTGQDEEEETEKIAPKVEKTVPAMLPQLPPLPNNLKTPKYIRTDILVQKLLKPKTEKKSKPEGTNQIEMVKKNVKMVQEYLSVFLGKNITIDLKNLEEQVTLFAEKELVKSEVFVTLCKKNVKAEQRNKVQKTAIEILSPEKVEGTFEAMIEEIHDVGYDAQFEPFVKTVLNLRKVNGNLLFYNTLNSFRVELDILDDKAMKGKFKITSRLDPALAQPKTNRNRNLQKEKLQNEQQAKYSEPSMQVQPTIPVQPDFEIKTENESMSVVEMPQVPQIPIKLEDIKTEDSMHQKYVVNPAVSGTTSVLPQNPPLQFHGHFQSPFHSAPFQKSDQQEFLTSLIKSQLNAPSTRCPTIPSTNIVASSSQNAVQNLTMPKTFYNTPPQQLSNQSQMMQHQTSSNVPSENLVKQTPIITEVIYPPTTTISSVQSQFTPQQHHQRQTNFQESTPPMSNLDIPVRETSVIKLSPNKALPKVSDYDSFIPKVVENFSKPVEPIAQPVSQPTTPAPPKLNDKIVIQEDIVISKAGEDQMDFEDALLASVLHVNNDFAERMKKEKELEERLERERKEEELKRQKLEKQRLEEELLKQKEIERQKLEEEKRKQQRQEELVRKEKEKQRLEEQKAEIARIEKEKREKEMREKEMREKEIREKEMREKEMRESEKRKTDREEREMRRDQERLRQERLLDIGYSSSSGSEIIIRRKRVRGRDLVINPISLLQRKKQKLSNCRVSESSFLKVDKTKVKPLSVRVKNIMSDISGKDIKIMDKFVYADRVRKYKKVIIEDDDDDDDDIVMVLDDSDSSKSDSRKMHPSTSRRTSNNNSNSSSKNRYYHVSFSFQSSLDSRNLNLTPYANPSENKSKSKNCNAITNNNATKFSNICCKNALKTTNNLTSDKCLLKNLLKCVDLDKKVYSDMNPYNLKKNSKNISKKFQQHRQILTEFDKNGKEDFSFKGDSKDSGSDLYEFSKIMLRSVPGMNSFEFFEVLPSSPKCEVVEIIHGVKTTSAVTTTTSTNSLADVNSDDSVDSDNKIKVDVDDFMVSESPPSSSQNNEKSDKSNNETIPVSAHIQKIGRPIILNKYNEQKTETKSNETFIQTSFVSAIKSAQSSSYLQKIEPSDKTSSALKVITCGDIGENKSSIQQSNSANKNQTLINMLSQQLLIPANNLNNRHFIITSSKQEPQKMVQQLPQMIEGESSIGNFKANTGIVQFICKTDGKKIHLTPICSPQKKQEQQPQKFIATSSTPIILNNLKKVEGQNLISIVKQEEQPKNFYEENLVKFSSSENKIIVSKGLTSFAAIPTITSISTNKTTAAVIQTLPKFNQAFGKTVFSITQDEKINVKAAGPAVSLQQGGTFQGNFLYARPYSISNVSNGKLVSSNNANNVVLTALRNKPNVRIISSIPEKSPTTIMPVRISVPLISRTNNNSDSSSALQAKIIRPVIHLSGNNQPSNLRQQFVITTAPRLNTTSTVVSPQNLKVENLLLTTTTTTSQNLQTQNQKVITQQTNKSVDHSTLEQLREFDMVFEQVKEKSTPTPAHTPKPAELENSPAKKQKSVIINHNVNNCSTGLSSPALSVTSQSSTSSTGVKTEPNSPQKSAQSSGKCKVKTSESGSGKSSGGSAGNVLKTTPKTQEDEQTAQRIYDILAEYAEQLRNSPDLNNKPAPRRRANPPTNPAAPSLKRKKIAKGMKSSEMSPDADRTSEEDSSCGMGSSIGVPSTSSMNNSPRGPLDDHADLSFDSFYQDIIKKENASETLISTSNTTSSVSDETKVSVAKKFIFTPEPQYHNIDPEDFLVSSDQQSIGTTTIKTEETKVTTNKISTILMPGNYLVPMNVLKSGQQLTILSSNNGQKILAVPANQLSSSPLLTSSCSTSSTAPMILQRYLNNSSPENLNSSCSTNLTNSKFKCSNKLLSKNAFLDEINSNILEKIETDLDTSDFTTENMSPFGNGVTCDSLFLTDDFASPATNDSFSDTIDDPLPKKKYKFVVRQNISTEDDE